MASITTRQTAGVGAIVAGAPLTNAQVDTNFINLNTEVYVDNFPVVKPSLMLDFANSDVVDTRVTFTRSTVATYYDALGVLQTAPINTPRLDHDPATLEPLGLLVEESRTNVIRNNTMVGVVAGSPGTTPTNWTQYSPLTGLTRTIVGSGVEKGISYIDVQFTGTASGAGEVTIRPESGTNTLFAASSTVTGSAWCALIGGSTANITSTSLRMMSYTSTNTYISEQGVAMPLTSTLTRFSNTYISAATSDRVYFVITLNVAAAAAVDITIRIGMPQLEQGAFVTSVIPTSTAALTRGADGAMVNTLTPWFNSTEYTMYYEGMCKTITDVQVFMGIGDTFDNTTYISRQSPWMLGSVRSANVGQAQMLQTATPTSGVAFKAALAVKANDFAFCYNGLTTLTDTSGIMPSSPVRLAIGSSPWSASGAPTGQQWVRRVAHYPRRLSNLELQAITT